MHFQTHTHIDLLKGAFYLKNLYIYTYSSLRTCNTSEFIQFRLLVQLSNGSLKELQKTDDAKHIDNKLLFLLFFVFFTHFDSFYRDNAHIIHTGVQYFLFFWFYEHSVPRYKAVTCLKHKKSFQANLFKRGKKRCSCIRILQKFLLLSTICQHALLVIGQLFLLLLCFFFPFLLFNEASKIVGKHAFMVFFCLFCTACDILQQTSINNIYVCSLVITTFRYEK